MRTKSRTSCPDTERDTIYSCAHDPSRSILSWVSENCQFTPKMSPHDGDESYPLFNI